MDIRVKVLKDNEEMEELSDIGESHLFIVEGLENDASYIFTVKARNGDVSNELSDLTNVIISKGKPNCPTRHWAIKIS